MAVFGVPYDLQYIINKKLPTVSQSPSYFVAIKRGLKLGRNVYIDDNVRFDGGYCHLISIGDDCTLTYGVKILAHDASLNRHIQHVKIGRVVIGRNSFIGYDSIILPNVMIGNNVIIGAGSVVTKSIPDNCVAVGCPAEVIDTTANLIKKHKQNLTRLPIFIRKDFFTETEKKSMLNTLEKNFGYTRRA